MNISFMYIFLNNWLSNNLLSWCLYSLDSILGIIFCWFYNWFLIDGLILSSIKSNLYIFSLNHWLDVGLVVNFFSRFIDSLNSWSLLYLSLSSDWLSIDDLSLRRNKVYSFGIINNRSLNNWLGNNFFGWGLEISVNSFIVKFSWSSNNWVILNSGLSSLNI